MIKAVLPGDGGFLAGVAGPDPYRAIHESLWTLYGGEAGPPRFWQTETGGLLSLSGEALTVSGDFSDPAELAAFCTVCGAKKLRGPRSVTEGAARILGWRVRVRQILSGEGAFCPGPLPQGFCEPSPRQVYPLLEAVFGLPTADFSAWYCETSHKLRHEQGRLLGVLAGGSIVSTAGIYHQNGSATLISSVATAPSHRGRGYAAALVGTLAAGAQKSGRIPFVICQNPAALRVYQQVGFLLWGEEWLCLREECPL